MDKGRTLGKGPSMMLGVGRAKTFSVTPREAAVIEHLVAGKANKEIALALACSPKTVEFHIKNLFRKVGVSSRLELVCRLLAPDAVA